MFELKNAVVIDKFKIDRIKHSSQLENDFNESRLKNIVIFLQKMCEFIQKLLTSEVQKPRAMGFIIFLKFLLQKESNIDRLVTMLLAFKSSLQNSIRVPLKAHPVDHIK